MKGARRLLHDRFCRLAALHYWVIGVEHDLKPKKNKTAGLPARGGDGGSPVNKGNQLEGNQVACRGMFTDMTGHDYWGRK